MADETDLSDTELAALAKEVAQRLERRGVLQAGTGAVAGGIGGYLAAGRGRAADTSAGRVGSAGNDVDVFLDELRDPGGDQVLDVDDTGDVVSQRGFQFPAVQTEKSYTAAPGEVQSALDTAEQDGRGVVTLKPGATYNDTQIEVHERCVLDCSGAIFEPPADEDVLTVRKDAQVINPVIDASGLSTYTSTAIHFAPVDNAVLAGRYPVVRAYVLGASGGGDDYDGGTALLVGRDGERVVGQRFDIKSFGIGTGLDVSSVYVDSNNNGYVKRCKFNVSIAHARYGIRLRGGNGSNSNIIYGSVQPDQDGNGDRGLDIRGGNNYFQVALADPGFWQDASVYFRSDAASNTVHDVWGGQNVSVTDNATPSDRNSYHALSKEAGGRTAVGYGWDVIAPSGTVAVGFTADASGGGGAVALGNNAQATGDQSTAVGAQVSNSNRKGTAVGRDSTVSGNRGVALGADSEAAKDGIAIGQGAQATAEDGIAIGRGTTLSQGDAARIGKAQLAFGATNGQIGDAALNNQEMVIDADEANSQFVLRYKDSNGTIQTATLSF